MTVGEDAATLDWLASEAGRAALATLPPYRDADALALATTLRARLGAERAAALLTQSRLATRARPRFGALADTVLFTPAGLEQASRPVVSAARAARLAAAGGATAADLCAGIGCDALALVAAGLTVTAVEADPWVAAVARHNLAGLPATVVVGDAAAADLTGVDLVYADPARRDEDGRRFDPADYRPPLPALLAVAGPRPLVVKAGPGIGHHQVPPGFEAQWVSVDGAVVEAALWSPALARPGIPRSALLLRTVDAQLTTSTEVTTAPADVPVGPVGRFVLEPDGAVIRAGLVGAVAAAVGGRLLDPRIAYVTTDEEAATPWARRFLVDAVAPFAAKRLRAMLRERDASDLVVKTRGLGVDPVALRASMRLSGAGPAVTVLLTRVGDQPLMVLTTPLPSSGVTPR